MIVSFAVVVIFMYDEPPVTVPVPIGVSEPLVYESSVLRYKVALAIYDERDEVVLLILNLLKV